MMTMMTMMMMMMMTMMMVVNAAAAKPTCHVQPAGLQVREADRIELGCGVEFSGSIAPSIDCRWSAGNRLEIVNSSITNGSTLLVELSVSVTPSMESKSIQCRTYFSTDLVNGSAAGHSAARPSYQYTWTSPTVHLVTGNTQNPDITHVSP